ncbi:hypothetical protein FDP41_004345 [Naegleria fowleri]|uniref:Uncharacterized protein n=1 Tax=Naegleria fowleri TaxID=5763 RepID=A0A6A5BNC3_NAEFO|nr:uncharacterized protein FDP41_004345 [Naegleria fowleri]KAF0976446.1 hypothetical protein FDP41_004345 [Naegleria fowleri]CAG4709175.1 unnamed protein product [Naegleria fowleri]
MSGGCRKAFQTIIYSVVFEKHDDCFKFSDTYSECVGTYLDEREAYIFAIKQMLKESLIEEDSGEELSIPGTRFPNRSGRDDDDRIENAMEDDGNEHTGFHENNQNHQELSMLLDRVLSISRSKQNNVSSCTGLSSVNINFMNPLMYKLARLERLNYYCLRSDELKQLHQYVLEKHMTHLCPCFSKKPSYRVYKVFGSILNDQVAPFIHKFEPLQFSTRSFEFLSDVQCMTNDSNSNSPIQK